MGQKKQDDEQDALADFFGGDVDWLDDDDTEALPADPKTGEELPVAPASDDAWTPAPADDAPADDAPADDAPADDAPADDAPADDAPADDAPADDAPADDAPAAPPPAPPPGAAVPDAVATVSDDAAVPGPQAAEAEPIGISDEPTAESPSVADEVTDAFEPAPTGEAPAPPTPDVDVVEVEASWEEEPETAEVAVTGDDLEAEGQAPEPMVHTPDAPPPRSDSPRDLEPQTEAVDLGATSAPAAPRTPPARYVPGDEVAAWRTAATTLISEAAVADPERRGPLLFFAARLYRRRLGDEYGARMLLDDALGAGCSDTRLHRERAIAALSEEDWATAEQAFAAQAETQSGTARAEALQDAAGMASQRDDVEGAISWLEQAIEADPDDYIALTLLRDQLAQAGDGIRRVPVLARMSALAPPAVAAELLWEKGVLLQGSGDLGEARSAWEAALEQWPPHAPSFLSLRASFLEVEDAEGRAGLYEREARREGQTDSGWWLLEAARAYAEAGAAEQARALYDEAAGMGEPQALREQQAWLLARGRHAEAAEALRAEIEHEKRGVARAYAWFRLGRLLERHLDDPAGALEAYEQAVQRDAAAEPAAEAATRLRRASGGGEALLESWEREASETSVPERQAALFVRVAELAETLGRYDQARTAWERVIEVVPDEPVALHGMYRVCLALGDREALGHVCRDLADRVESPGERAGWLYLGASGGGAPEVDLPVLREAHEAAPGDVVVLEALARGYRDAGAWAELAAVLEQSAAAAAGQRRAILLYRAARAYHDRLRDLDRAADCVARALDEAPDLPALQGLRAELTAARGASQESWALYRERAEQAGAFDVRAWWRVAAADAAASVEGASPVDELRAVLGERPAHPGALAALELHALITGDRSLLADAWQAAADAESSQRRRAEMLVWLAETLQERGEVSPAREALRELAGIHASRAPMRAAARLAEAQHEWAEAVTLLKRAGAPEDLLERARILGYYDKDLVGAAEAYQDLLDDPVVGVAAAWGLMQVARAAGDDSALLVAHAALARAGGQAFRVAHYAWAADLHELAGDHASAVACHREALALEPDSRTTFDALRRLLVAEEDTEGLRALYAEQRPDDLRGIAADLESAGDDEGALEAWRRAAEVAEHPLSILVELERILARSEAWSDVFEVLGAIRERVQDPAVVEAVEERRRWVLSERLADTAEAWDVYRRLHEAHPDDRAITEGLARVATERGEHDLALECLQQLAETAGGPREAARHQRALASLHEGRGDVEAARQAWLDALDHVPDDLDALDGLQRLAEQGADFEAAIAVLQRRAGVVDGEERLEALREVARITEEHLERPAVALETWQAVLEARPDDLVALQRLLALAQSQGAWAVYVDTAVALAEHRAGPERGELLRRAGVASEEHLDRDPLPFYERAAAIVPPDTEAARRLLAHVEDRRDHVGTVRALRILAEAPETAPDDRVELLARAARLEAEELHERERAADRWREVLEHDPDHTEALAWMARWLYDRAAMAEAIPYYERLEPQLSEASDADDFDAKMELALHFFQFARALEQVGRTDDALLRYERALERNPTHLPSLQAVAPLYVQAERWADAEQAWRALIQLIGGTGDKERVADAYVKLGFVELERDKVDKAFKRFHKARELVEHHVRALEGLARVYEIREDWDHCMKSWNNIVYHATERSDVVRAYVTKGRLLDESLQRTDKAAEHYERALEVLPDQAGPYLRLAELALRGGRDAEAEHRAHRGLKYASAPGRLRADLLLCWALARVRRGDAEAARSAVDEARNVHPELSLPADPLADPDALLEGIRARLPE